MKKQKELPMEEKKLVIAALHLTRVITAAGLAGYSFEKLSPKYTADVRQDVSDCLEAYRKAKKNVSRTTAELYDNFIIGLVNDLDIGIGLKKWSGLEVKL